MEIKADSEIEKNNKNNDLIKKNEIEEERNEKFEFLKVVKERQNFPCKFTKEKEKKKIINYYDKNWEDGISDDDEENDGDDDSDKAKGKIIVDSSSSSSERRRRRRKKSSSSSD